MTKKLLKSSKKKAGENKLNNQAIQTNFVKLNERPPPNDNTDYFDLAETRTEILGHQGSQYIKFKLKKNEKIITALGCLIYLDNNVIKGQLQFDGVMSGIKKFFAGESLYYSIYKGNNENKEGIVMIGTSFIDSVIRLKVEYGKPLRLSRGVFIASTDNIQIDMTVQFNISSILGIGNDEGFILPTASYIGNDITGFGYIWISAFGVFEKIEVPDNEFIIINNGIFLACETKYQYEMSQLGDSLLSSFLSGEGFGLKFNGPCSIYIQTKNINSLIDTSGAGGGEGEAVANPSFFDNFNEII